jgi:hypothetical protein
MNTIRDYRWSSIFAWGLTLSGASLAVGGVVGMFWPATDISALCIVAFAGMMAFGIGLVNCSAAGALQAVKHRKEDGRQVDWTVLAPALAVCFGFAFATNIGVHMGWEVVKANAPAGAHLPPAVTIDAVFYIFAFAKPAMAWIVEGRKAMDAEVEARRIATRKKEQAEREQLELARLAALNPKPESVKKAGAIRAAAKRASQTEAEAGEHVSAKPAKAKTSKPAAKAERAVQPAPAVAPSQYGSVNKAQVEKAAARIREVMRDAKPANIAPLPAEQVERARDLLRMAGQTPTAARVAEMLRAPVDQIEAAWPADEARRDEDGDAKVVRFG